MFVLVTPASQEAGRPEPSWGPRSPRKVSEWKFATNICLFCRFKKSGKLSWGVGHLGFHLEGAEQGTWDPIGGIAGIDGKWVGTSGKRGRGQLPSSLS
jgi:hypothetical protein